MKEVLEWRKLKGARIVAFFVGAFVAWKLYEMGVWDRLTQSPDPEEFSNATTFGVIASVLLSLVELGGYILLTGVGYAGIWIADILRGATSGLKLPTLPGNESADNIELPRAEDQYDFEAMIANISEAFARIRELERRNGDNPDA